MDATELIKHQLGSMRRFVGGILNGLTDEQLNWRPPGTANPIGVSWLHLLTVEDEFIQATFQEKPRLWESQGWTAKTGIHPRASDESWDRVKQTYFSVAPLQAYGAAVREAVARNVSVVAGFQSRNIIVIAALHAYIRATQQQA